MPRNNQRPSRNPRAWYIHTYLGTLSCRPPLIFVPALNPVNSSGATPSAVGRRQPARRAALALITFTCCVSRARYRVGPCARARAARLGEASRLVRLLNRPATPATRVAESRFLQSRSRSAVIRSAKGRSPPRTVASKWHGRVHSRSRSVFSPSRNSNRVSTARCATTINRLILYRLAATLIAAKEDRDVREKESSEEDRKNIPTRRAKLGEFLTTGKHSRRSRKLRKVFETRGGGEESARVKNSYR